MGGKRKGMKEKSGSASIEGGADDVANDPVLNESIVEDNEMMRTEVTKHKQELLDLKDKDPEFYEFLKEYDRDLLDFDWEEKDNVPNDEIAEDVLEDATEEKEKTKSHEVLSLSLVEEWCKSAKEKNSAIAIRKLIKAFRSACHWGDDEESKDKSDTTLVGVGLYRIGGSEVFNKILVFCLKEMDSLLRNMLKEGAEKGEGVDDVDEKKPMQGGKTSALDKNPRWKRVEPLLKSYLGNSLHILGQMNDENLLSFTLKRLTVSVDLLKPFPILTRKFLKAVLHLWGSGHGSLPLVSLFFLRAMADKLPEPWPEESLRGLYRVFAAHVKSYNPSNAKHVAFLVSSTMEMFSHHPALAYPLAFSYIRQLAVLLRNALSVKTKDALQRVYCWQYIQCLSLWVQVVSCPEPGLQGSLSPLVYPLSQVLLATARLVPSARYFPLRAHCARLLNQLGRASGAYLPVSALLLDMLQGRELKPGHRPTQGQGREMDWAYAVKVPKNVPRTRAFQEETVSVFVELLSEHLAQWSLSVAFPELSVLPAFHVRRFLKTCRVDRFRTQLRQLLDQVEASEALVTLHRDRVDFSPKDLARAAEFLQDKAAAGDSPLIRFAASIQRKAKQRSDRLAVSEVIVGGEEDDSEDDKEVPMEEEEEAGFAKEWPPVKLKKGTDKGKEGGEQLSPQNGGDEDMVEDLVLSDDEEEEEQGNGDAGFFQETLSNVKGPKRKKGKGHEKCKGKKTRKQ